MDVFSGHFEDMHRTVLQNCNNMQQQHSMKYTAKSAILILRKKILKTSKRLLLLCNILLVRQISHSLLTKNLHKHIFA